MERFLPLPKNPIRSEPEERYKDWKGALALTKVLFPQDLPFLPLKLFLSLFFPFLSENPHPPPPALFLIGKLMVKRPLWADNCKFSKAYLRHSKQPLN